MNRSGYTNPEPMTKQELSQYNAFMRTLKGLLSKGKSVEKNFDASDFGGHDAKASEGKSRQLVMIVVAGKVGQDIAEYIRSNNLTATVTLGQINGIGVVPVTIKF